MNPANIRRCIKKWELMRLLYNAACLLGAWFSWNIANSFSVAIDERPAASISDPGVLWNFCFGFVVLNIAYSLVYAVEFFLLARTSQCGHRALRIVLFVVGCILGTSITAKATVAIADNATWKKSINTRSQPNATEMREP